MDNARSQMMAQRLMSGNYTGSAGAGRPIGPPPVVNQPDPEPFVNMGALFGHPITRNVPQTYQHAQYGSGVGAGAPVTHMGTQPAGGGTVGGGMVSPAPATPMPPAPGGGSLGWLGLPGGPHFSGGYQPPVVKPAAPVGPLLLPPNGSNENWGA